MAGPTLLVVGSYGAGLTYLVDRAPGAGETVATDRFSVEHGGKGSNQAVAASRLGATVHLVTALGDDTFAASARELWRAERVTAHARTAPDLPTMNGAIVVDAAGENRIVVASGALSSMGADDVAVACQLLAVAEVCVGQLEIPANVVADVFTAARDRGVVTVLDPAPVPADASLTGLLDVCDHLVPNAHEAALLAGAPMPPAAAAERLARDHGCVAVVTAGDDGAYGHDGHQRWHCPSAPVDVVDTTDRKSVV